MDPRAAWIQALGHPAEDFFPLFAARLREADGWRGAVCEAIEHLVPRVDWEGYLPQMPHGLLGLRAVLRLEGLLEGRSFLRLLATQLHAFAGEGRSVAGGGLEGVGAGSGHWPNLEMALREHRPAIAWGEALGVAGPSEGDFARLLPFAAGDMANAGHKAVAVIHLGDLLGLLGGPAGAGRRLLGLAAWLVAAPPSDRFWHARARRRLEGQGVRVDPGPARLGPEQHVQGAREICDLGLVAMLDAFTARMAGGASEGDLRSILALAASEKQLDARRELEGRTAWNLVYLAALPVAEALEPWAQAAALVNFFPSDDEEVRVKAAGAEGSADPAALLDAVLDAEPARAMGLASALRCSAGDGGVLRVLAEAAAHSDPVFNRSHQILALAAVTELLPRVTGPAGEALLQALAKSLAGSQGSGELGRLADRALRGA